VFLLRALSGLQVRALLSEAIANPASLGGFRATEGVLSLVRSIRRAAGPSEHLAWHELACHDGTPYPLEWRESRGIALAAEFEAIREACGNRPIRVLSAYRTEDHNTAVGGSKHSQHIEGRALDLAPPDGMTLEEFWRTANHVAGERKVIRGLGLYGSFVHIDIRPGKRVRKWSGSRALAELRQQEADR